MVLPDGMSYRVLVLPQIDRIRPELLRKIRDLVAGGVTLIGPKPTLSPSLQGGYPQADAEVQALANEIWGDLDGVQRNRHFVGKGLVTWGLTPGQVVAQPDPQLINPLTGALPPETVQASLNLAKDAEFAGPLDASIVWIHRRTSDADIYFVANRRDRAQEIGARFRVAGKEAELWHPDTGDIEPASYTIENGRTTVPLRLEPRESVFVVFRLPAAHPSRRGIFLAAYVRSQVFFLQRLRLGRVFGLNLGKVSQELAHGGVRNLFNGALVKTPAFELHDFRLLAHRVNPQRPHQPHRRVMYEPLDVMLADQRNMLAEALAESFDQAAAMPGFFLLHLVKHLGRGRVGFTQPVGKITVNARVLFLQRNRER